MKKPEKKKQIFPSFTLSYPEGWGDEGYFNGYNKACDDWEKYHNYIVKDLLEACKMALPHLKIIQRKVPYEVLPYTKLKQVTAKVEESEG